MSDAKRLTIEEAAQVMGMREREVREVVLTAAGNVVRTHDGIGTLIGPDGKPRGAVPAPARRTGGVLVEIEPDDEPVEAADDDKDEAKTTPRRRRS